MPNYLLSEFPAKRSGGAASGLLSFHCMGMSDDRSRVIAKQVGPEGCDGIRCPIETDLGRGRWQKCQLAEVRTIQVESWLRTLPLAKSSCAKVRNLMSVLFNHACRYELFDHNGALKSALEATRPSRVVCLSTIGAQATQSHLLTQHTIIEQVLGEVSMPITFLRPGWFMENCSWNVASATNDGVISSFLQPIDKPVPMVATADIGRVAAELLRETWKVRRASSWRGRVV